MKGWIKAKDNIIIMLLIVLCTWHRWIVTDVDVAMGRFVVLELSVMIARSETGVRSV